MNEADLRHWLIALRTPKLGHSRLREAVAASAGRMDVALGLLRHAVAERDSTAYDWLERPDEEILAQDIAWLTQPEHRLCCFTEADFPPLLEHISAPPVALFVAGDASLLLRPQIAIVGARKATPSGLATARDFARSLACSGFLVTSGLAAGIDGAAHAAALDAGLPTVAVIGTGPDRVYPRSHRALAQRIMNHGVWVSEFPPGTPPLPHHFPQRNRIIAGLSLGTLVIEAGLQSGSLITARLAGEQGREVLVVPGSIYNQQARGCHGLIRDGARLVETPEEVAQILAPLARQLGCELAERLDPPALAARVPVCWQQDRQYQHLLDTLGHDPTSLDVLCERTGQTVAELSSMLLMLELEGVVKTLPGNRYQRLPG